MFPEEFSKIVFHKWTFSPILIKHISVFSHTTSKKITEQIKQVFSASSENSAPVLIGISKTVVVLLLFILLYLTFVEKVSFTYNVDKFPLLVT